MSTKDKRLKAVRTGSEDAADKFGLSGEEKVQVIDELKYVKEEGGVVDIT